MPRVCMKLYCMHIVVICLHVSYMLPQGAGDYHEYLLSKDLNVSLC